MKDWRKKIPITKINKDLDKYQKGKRVLEIVAESKKWFAETEMPDIYYQMQAEIEAKHRYDTASINEPLAVACEPTPTYNAPKQEEK